MHLLKSINPVIKRSISEHLIQKDVSWLTFLVIQIKNIGRERTL